MVLPQPDSPTKPKVSPFLMEKETPSTAFKGVVLNGPVLMGKYCFKSLTSIMGLSLIVGTAFLINFNFAGL